MKTTLNKIREHNPCKSGWKKLLKNLGKTQADDEPLAITTILESNGVDDALWCLRAVDGYQREMRLFAVGCARSVQHLMKDQRSIDAIDIAERYANGLATNNELDAARAAAWNAAWAASFGGAATSSVWVAIGVASAIAWDAAWATAASAAAAAVDIASCETQANYLCLICTDIEQMESV
jgi:hypothetical protein